MSTEYKSAAEIIQQIRRPGKVYVGMLINSDVAYIVAEKTDLIAWLSDRLDMDDCGIYATRNGTEPLHIHNS
jgi:hypothetical protein